MSVSFLDSFIRTENFYFTSLRFYDEFVIQSFFLIVFFDASMTMLYEKSTPSASPSEQYKRLSI
jgi:hypothetical protein